MDAVPHYEPATQKLEIKKKTKTYQIIRLILNNGSTSIVLANVSFVIF